MLINDMQLRKKAGMRRIQELESFGKKAKEWFKKTGIEGKRVEIAS